MQIRQDSRCRDFQLSPWPFWLDHRITGRIESCRVGGVNNRRTEQTASRKGGIVTRERKCMCISSMRHRMKGVQVEMRNSGRLHCYCTVLLNLCIILLAAFCLRQECAFYSFLSLFKTIGSIICFILSSIISELLKFSYIRNFLAFVFIDWLFKGISREIDRLVK